MADGTCYAILTAGVWEATPLTHRQVISARCRKEGTGNLPAEGINRLFRFSLRTKAKFVIARLQL